MIKNLFKGMVIGIANIVPGVSGGTMAVSMGIYDKLLHCITHLFKEFKKSITFLLPIFVGMGIALVGLSFVIGPAFERFPIAANCLFIGLIVGGLPAAWKKVKGNKIKASHIISMLGFLALVVGFAVIGERKGNSANLTFSFLNVIKLFAVGIIASATMVIPGISGSMMMLLMGYYNPIIATIKNLSISVASLNGTGILNCLGVLVPFLIGIIAGIFMVAKLIEFIFKKFPLQAFWGIIGLIAASPIAIFLMGEFGTVTPIGIITGIVAFACGFVVASSLGEPL